MRMFIAVAVVTLAAQAPLRGQPALPVIDVHLHALPADSQGPPPLAMCTPVTAWSAWDSGQACTNSAWSIRHRLAAPIR